MKIRIKALKNTVFLAIILPMTAIFPVKSVNADIVEHLYEAEVPVEGQGKEERIYVVREALKEVLVRISGRNSAADLAMNEELVPKPTAFIQQFRYRKFSDNEVIPAALEGAKPYTRKLWLRFTKKEVAKLLREQGLPVWGKTRPATLLWLAVDDQNQRRLIGNSTEHPSRTYIEKGAIKRGLPFRLPLLDLADQLKLQVTDVWGNFEDSILSASSRYQTQAILVGRIYLSFGNTWHTRWTLYSAGQRNDWETSNNETLDVAIQSGLSVTAESLSARFNQFTDAELNESVILQVNNVKTLSAYNQTIKYLKSLSVVTNVRTQLVNKNNVFFTIKSGSGRLGIAQSIGLGHKLVVDNALLLGKNNSNDSGSQSQSLKAELIYKLVLK